MNSPYISIIIPNFNGEKYLETCLSSVLRSAYKNFEILIIDDGSTDKSQQIIRKFVKMDKRILYEKNSKNLGAAASRNRAVKIAKGKLLVFLDNDTAVDPLWLSELEKTLSSSKQIGACQALLRDFDKRDVVQVAGLKLWAATAWGLPKGLWEKYTNQYSQENIIALSAALAVKKEVFEMIGGFDELEAVVTEDLDFCWRIWIAGYKIVLSPHAFVYHMAKTVEMRSNMKHTAEKIYFHLTKNSLTSMIKNYELPNVLKNIFLCLIISFGRAILVLFRRGDLSALQGSLRAIVWVCQNLKPILKKRKITQQGRVYTDAVLFKNIFEQGSIFSIYKKYFLATNLL